MTTLSSSSPSNVSARTTSQLNFGGMVVSNLSRLFECSLSLGPIGGGKAGFPWHIRECNFLNAFDLELEHKIISYQLVIYGLELCLRFEVSFGSKISKDSKYGFSEA